MAYDGGYYVGKWKDGQRDGFGFSVAPHEVVKCGGMGEGTVPGRTNAVPFGTDIRHRHFQIPTAQAPDVRHRLEEPAHYTSGAYGRPECVEGRWTIRSLSSHQIHGGADGVQSLLYAGCVCRTPVWVVVPWSALTTLLPPVLAMCQADYTLKNPFAEKRPSADARRGTVRTKPGLRRMGGRGTFPLLLPVWLKEVGCRSQHYTYYICQPDFVNRYMPFAPEELKKKYPVWVASLREYKFHTCICFTGSSRTIRVRGIRGDVDIDVQRFGGTVQEVFADAKP